ncbi:hypothetical protein GC093_06930 [Paenibacillus sp. LMG 31456]|uniref:Uncharacterized protein n=1 Tax=Paenibacillus foliorum TaxID=2654974 RepID=A0A972GR87_9BACL|nr:hypothetical protein [Paenibacillus foliorum]NOU92969.1 hypothetical protein [Paenibacillus foliorum]
MLNIILLYIIMMLFFSICGLILITLLKLEHKQYYLISPIIGLAALIIYSQNIGLILSGKYLSTILFIVILLSLIYYNKKIFSNFKIFLSENKLVILLFSLSSFISLLPQFIVGRLTSFNSFNNDLIVYLLNPEWLNSNKYLSEPPKIPGYPLIDYSTILIKNALERVGLDYITLNISNLTGLETYQIFGTLACLLFSLLGVILYELCKNYLKLSKNIALISLILSSTSPLMMNVMFSQFIPQICGIVLMLLTICFFIKVLYEKNIPNIVLLSIAGASAVGVYAEIIIYLFIFCLCYLIANYKDFLHNFIKNIIFILIITFITVLFNVPGFIIMFHKQLMLMKLSGTDAGNITFFIPTNNYIALILGYLPFPITQSFTVMKYLVILSLIFIAYGFIKSKIFNKLFYCYMISFGFLIFIYFRYYKMFPYGTYKHIIFMESIFIIIISISISFYINNFKKVMLVLLSIFIIVNLINIYKIQNRVLTNELLINKDFIELKEIKNIVPKDIPITINLAPFGETHLASYFLRDRKILLNNVSYFSYYGLNDLTFKQQTPMYILTSFEKQEDIYRSEKEKIIWQNDRFKLLYTDNFLGVSFEKGFYNVEKSDQSSWRWMNNEGYIKIKSSQNKEVDLSFDINNVVPSSITEYKTGKVFVNDEYIGDFKAFKNKNNKIKFEKIKLISEKENVVRIEIVEGADTVPSDSRPLSILTTNFQINY